MFEMVSNQIIKNKSIQRKVPENEKVDIKELSKVQHVIGGVKFWAITTKVTLKMKNMRVEESRK